MAVRQRVWMTTGGEERRAWLADYVDVDGKRRHKTFHTKGQATSFVAAVQAANSAEVSAPLARGRTMYAFISPLPKSKKRDGCQAVLEALLSAYPGIKPSACPVIVHVTAECAPQSVVCDVDNLLKPVLDALAGHVYVNDTQVVECLARKIPSTKNRLRIRVWLVPTLNGLPYVD
jgi:Holliday junction resolvase RusA-like endonuclease